MSRINHCKRLRWCAPPFFPVQPLLRPAWSNLHSILPGDGGAKFRVVQEGNVDSDQWRAVSRQDLTSDYRHQAARTNKQMRGPG